MAGLVQAWLDIQLCIVMSCLLAALKLVYLLITYLISASFDFKWISIPGKSEIFSANNCVHVMLIQLDPESIEELEGQAVLSACRQIYGLLL